MHINRKSLEQLQIPDIGITEQNNIAFLLGKAEILISHRKESIGLLNEFLKSKFLEMFGDPEKNPNNFPCTELENLCTEIVDCPHSTPIKAKARTDYPCIRTSELINGYIYWDSMQYLDKDEYNVRVRRLVPQEGDIVYGREGTFGEAIRIPATHKFSLGQRTMLFRPNFKKTNSVYLWAMVRSDFVYRQAKKKNSGSTVGHINVKDIKQFKILNPPIELQNNFSEQVQKIESIKIQYLKSLQELENLNCSLSQIAFRGEL
jgi:type I restriction enzyme S subunit